MAESTDISPSESMREVVTAGKADVLSTGSVADSDELSRSLLTKPQSAAGERVTVVGSAKETRRRETGAAEKGKPGQSGESAPGQRGNAHTPDGRDPAEAGSPKRRALKASLKAAAADEAMSQIDETPEFEGTQDAYRKGHTAHAMAKRIRAGRESSTAHAGRKSAGAAKGKADAASGKAAWGKGGQARAAAGKAATQAGGLAQTATAPAASAAKGGAAKTIAGAISSIAAPLAGAACGILAFVLVAMLVGQLLSALFGFWENEANKDTGSLSGIELQIAEELREYGFSDAAIAGILGNLAAESGLDPASDVVMDGMFNYAYERACGIFQYTSTSPGTGEYWAFKSWCSKEGKQWSSVEAQMEWTFSGKHPQGTWSSRWSMALARSGYYSNCAGYKGTGAYTAAQYKEADDVDKAAYSWMACYERPANGSYAHLDKRISEAERYYAMLTSSEGATGKAATIVAAAESQLGVPYVWGGSTPGKALDCSGLTQYCYAQAGIRISHYTESQLSELKAIPLSKAQPGDILYRPGHVAIYIGGNEYIHEPHTGAVCCKATGISYFTCALTYR